MFVKPYKLKSNNTLKNSEKKQLLQRMKDEFPSASEEKLKELLPAKSSCSCMRLVVHSGDAVGVLVVDGAPLLLDTAGGLVPTVCALWRVPDLLPTITIHTAVLPKIVGGAPLYVPGVEVSAARGGGAGALPMFPRGATLAARTQDNAAAALVGRALLSSADMLFRATGVCLETLQVAGDLLCREPKFGRIQRPQFGPDSSPAPPAPPADALADHVAQLQLEPVSRDEWPGLPQRAPAPPAPASAPARLPPAAKDTLTDDEDANDTGCCSASESGESGECGESGASEVPRDMDALLRWSLLTFLKLHAARVALPLKTNLLYKNHLIPLCPPDRALDVRKSSYKKMSKFLEAMQQEGLVEVREIEKGVDALTALNAGHAAVRAHRVPAGVRAGAGGAGGAQPQGGYEPPQVRDMLCVTAHVAGLFPHVKKGTALTPAEVRAALTEYVRSRGLHAAERGAVLLDAPLAKVANMREQECMKWEALMAAVAGRMTAATEMRFGDGAARLARSRLEPVRMQVATRSGNKKVTLVSNLEAYGFSLGALSHACQLGVGAACGVTRAPGAAADQLMLQGDQTHFVAKLLIEKYGLPKKFIEGADKALNKKK